MSDYLTYLYLLTPLHTGASSQEGNLMGIAREVHTEFPYLPSSSLRGRIRAELEKSPAEGESDLRNIANDFFGRKIVEGSQPTEGEVWFADATLLLFPIASLSHHLVWITCPLWLERWCRWSAQPDKISTVIQKCYSYFSASQNPKSAVVSFPPNQLCLQTSIIQSDELVMEDFSSLGELLTDLLDTPGLVTQLMKKIIVVTNEDCAALVEMGLQREVRVALESDSKTVKGGSFRSEEAIPPESIMFFPWGTKPPKSHCFQEANANIPALTAEEKQQQDETIRSTLKARLTDQRMQFGGLESLGRGWSALVTEAR